MPGSVFRRDSPQLEHPVHVATPSQGQLRRLLEKIHILACLRMHFHLSPIEENRSSPAIPEPTTMIGSGTFQRDKTRKARQAIIAVDRSRMECRARTKTAPAMAPVAAAVTPLTNALIPLLREKRR